MEARSSVRLFWMDLIIGLSAVDGDTLAVMGESASENKMVVLCVHVPVQCMFSVT